MPKTNPFVHHYPKVFDENEQPTGTDDGARHEHLIAHVMKTVPRAIAHLEKAYPGATYAALGRDAVVMSDVLEAYYSSFRQMKRAARINVSTPSFTGNAADIVDLVTSTTPLDFDKLHKRGFVVYDNTSYGAQSQSMQVMRALYGELGRRGEAPAAFVRKLNLVSLWSYGGAMPLPGDSSTDAFLKSYFDEQELHVRNRGGSPPGAVLRMPFIGYGLAWHGPWGRMTRSGSTVSTEPSSEGHATTHESILWEAHEVLHAVKSPEFRQAVEHETAAVGIKAPHLSQSN